MEESIKEILKKLWKYIYVDYRNIKLDLIQKYADAKFVADSCKEVDLDEEYEKINKLIDSYKLEIEKLDKDMLEHVKYDGTMFNWIKSEFINAVVAETNIELERKIHNDDNLHVDDYVKANKIIYIVYELIQDLDEENPNNNLKVIETINQIEYKIKGITLFADDTFPTEKNFIFHGTTLRSARNIYIMKRLFTRSNGEFYNKNKIFFSDNLEDAKNYALRNTTDDIHIIFKIDTKGIELFRRKHLIISREGDLYFANDDSLDVNNRIAGIYLVGNEITEITEEEFLGYRSIPIVDNENFKKANIYKRLTNEYRGLKPQLKKDVINKVLTVAKEEGITTKQVLLDKYKISEDFYNTIFSTVKTFNNMEEHINYLKQNGILTEQDEITILDDNKDRLYHGTHILSAKQIFKEGVMKSSSLREQTSIAYNKIFFSDDINYAQRYGRIGSIVNYYGEQNDRHILFECDLSDYTVYCYPVGNEYAVWGSIPTDCIKHIYLCDKDMILKELTRQELLDLKLDLKV